jgi:hypothetical protein
MVRVSEEGKNLLKAVEKRSNALRTMKADFEERLRIALHAETEEHREDLAQTVAALLDEGVPKTQIAQACGYKNYYVSLKDIDARAQKYRGVVLSDVPSVPEEEGGREIEWSILTRGDWSEPNQWGEREILLGLKVNEHPVEVYVTEFENVRTITYVDVFENPSVTVSDVNALKNEIMEALND